MSCKLGSGQWGASLFHYQVHGPRDENFRLFFLFFFLTESPLTPSTQPRIVMKLLPRCPRFRLFYISSSGKPICQGENLVSPVGWTFGCVFSLFSFFTSTPFTPAVLSCSGLITHLTAVFIDLRSIWLPL